MQWFETEELAVAVLGYCDDDELDSETIEEKIYEKLGVEMEQFQKVAEALMPFTIPAETAVSGKFFYGFVKDGAFIVKQPMKPNAGGNSAGTALSCQSGAAQRSES